VVTDLTIETADADINRLHIVYDRTRDSTAKISVDKESLGRVIRDHHRMVRMLEDLQIKIAYPAGASDD